MATLSILVRGVTGTGPTSLAAFDDALLTAGLANLNLIRLSSVIPPGSVVAEADRGEAPLCGPAGWGDRLYAVWAFQSADLLGEEAWAGVAWVQRPDDGSGLFVEHEGTSEAQVRRELDATLAHMCRSRGWPDLPVQTVVAGARCEGEPVAALVIAPYRTGGW